MSRRRFDSGHPPQPKLRDNFRSWDDPAYNDLRRIFSEPKIREVLTHDSFYEASKDGGKAQGNGRYVFAGMTVFKGQVAEIKKLRDAKRRQSQAEAKARKTANAARAAAKAAKESRPMSANKRRHLEDKRK